MTLLYQPISRTFGQRDGCLTPISGHEGKDRTRSDAAAKNILDSITSAISASASNHEILSPPLSPYQKDSDDASHDAKADFPALSTSEHYLAVSHPFKINNYKSYSLTVNPWSDLNSQYKQKQIDFLSQYNFEAPRALRLHTVRVSEKRTEKRRREVRPTTSQSDSDSDPCDRVRTRKLVRESLVVEDDTSSEAAKESSVPSLPSPKRRRVRKEPSYDGLPLAAQQASLIDESIPDYSPDTHTTLPKGNTRALKIEWKGQPMDLRDDPNLDKLHPAEVLLASTLRLRCNVYLDSKRRFFSEKVSRMRNGMPFRRTDAQKACRIDVNKASRLFAAFEKAGWLDDKHFKQYL